MALVSYFFYYIMNLINHSVGYSTQHEKLYGGDPNFYWKQNYYYNWVDNCMNSLSICPFEDRIQANSLLEHKQVILHVMGEVSESIRCADFDIHYLPPPEYDLLSFEFADYFLDLLGQQQVLSHMEALQFSLILGKRNDWKKLFVELIQLVENKFHYDLAYIFYISLKIVIEIRSYVKLTSAQLKSLLCAYISSNQGNFEQKLLILSRVEEFKGKLEKLCLTMMLAIYGIFVNPFYDSKEQKYKQLQFSIKQQENKWARRRSIKIKNRKPSQSLRCSPPRTV